MRSLITLLGLAYLSFSQNKIDIGFEPLKASALEVNLQSKIIDEEGFYERVYAKFNSNNTLVIADAGNKRVLVYQGSKLINEFGEEGSGPEEINDIFGLELIDNDRILIRTQGYYKIFDYNGRYIHSINSHEYGFSDLIVRNGQIIRSFSGNNSKYLRVNYDKNGEEKSKIENKNYKEPEESKSFRMVFISSFGATEYQGFIAKSIGKTYQIDLLDENFNVIKQYVRSFERVKRDFSNFKFNFSFKGGSKKEAAKMRANAEQQMKKQMGNYYSDIRNILGVYNDALIVRTASSNPQRILKLDIIQDDKLYSQFEKTFDDDILNVNVSNNKLIISFKNDADGPFVKIYDLVLN